MRFVFRNLWRRKARTTLTVFGIVVGIFALTVLGGLSARLNQQAKGARDWFTASISVVPSGGSLFGGGGERFFEYSIVNGILTVPGVKNAAAGIGTPLKSSQGFSLGAPELIIGLDLAQAQDLFKILPLSEGRAPEEGDRRKVALGNQIAKNLGASVGGTVQLRDERFEVVGIFEPTLSAPDQFGFVSYPDGLELFQKANPYIQQAQIATVVYVVPRSGTDPEALAAKLNEQLADVRVISPKEAEQQISQFSLVFNAILLGSALIALIVGGLSIINTMVMSVSERTREIGLKKAIGAETRTILGEYLFESAGMGLLGGLIGTGLGVLMIFVLNNATKSNNVTVFGITVTVVVGPIIFATVLGGLAGIVPALRAARLKPVDSLKED
ncbi:MAG: ABC transporter permease [Actinobacteria bacterium]|nr:ABC transporter permease [Actinomycetota bacterium]